MCAIFGIGFMKGHKAVNSKVIRLIVKNLFALSQDRGRIATGVAITNEKEVLVLKKNLPASTFVNEEGYVELMEKWVNFDLEQHLQPISIIGHCRFPTKGAPENNDNNHPIVANNIIGVQWPHRQRRPFV